MSGNGKTAPGISVVVAVHDELGANLGACLRPLLDDAARHPGRAEIIVSGPLVAGAEPAPSPALRRIGGDRSRLVPRSWEEGLRAARAPVVALTTSAFVPRDDWIDRIVAAHGEGSAAAVGGLIAQRKPAGPVLWGTYFCRYSAFMDGSGPRREVSEIAGDNASYRREVIDRYPAERSGGFWETEVHRAMRRDGCRILLDPGIVVEHAHAPGLASFMAQRLLHGRTHASDRGRGMSSVERFLRIVLSPVTPFVMIARIARRVIAAQRHAAAFIASSPILFLFLCAWAFGECWGYLAPVREES